MRLVIGGGAPIKRHQQDPARVGPLDDQTGEGVGLSGTCSCDDQQRCRPQSSRSPVLDRTPLLGIEGFEVRGCNLHLKASVYGRNKRPSMIPAVIATIRLR
jgi:hypothetical protein